MTPKIFSIEEVDALIPELSRRVALQLALGAEIESLVKRLARETNGSVDSLDPEPGETEPARALRADLKNSVIRYEDGWRTVQSMGAVVKDTTMGLLDFYGRLDGRLVWLCWRYGEDKLDHYHELDAGFSGRRSLGATERQRVLN
jgi:hypothetical protein